MLTKGENYKKLIEAQSRASLPGLIVLLPGNHTFVCCGLLIREHTSWVCSGVLLNPLPEHRDLLCYAGLCVSQPDHRHQGCILCTQVSQSHGNDLNEEGKYHHIHLTSES